MCVCLCKSASVSVFSLFWSFLSFVNQSNDSYEHLPLLWWNCSYQTVWLSNADTEISLFVLTAFSVSWFNFNCFVDTPPHPCKISIKNLQITQYYVTQASIRVFCPIELMAAFLSLQKQRDNKWNVLTIYFSGKIPTVHEPIAFIYHFDWFDFCILS